MKRIENEGSVAIFFLFAAVASGCAYGEEGAGETGRESAEKTATVTQALEPCLVNHTCFDYSAPSVTVRVSRGPWSPTSASPSINAALPLTDWVLVGGGAEIEGSTPTPGALLTGSFPDGAPNSWRAESKDHVRSHPHRVRAYAIGLRLAGYTTGQLRLQVQLRSASSPAAGQASPSAFVQTLSNELILGGGARATSLNGAGQLLWQSHVTAVTGGGGWYAASREHLRVAPGVVTAYVLSIPACPPGLGYCLTAGIQSWWGTNGTGYQSSATVVTATDWVTTGIGDVTSTPSGSRFITDLIPVMHDHGGAAVYSKDHVEAAVGRDLAQAIALRRL